MEVERDGECDDRGGTHIKRRRDSLVSESEWKSSEKNIFADGNCDSFKDFAASDLKFDEETKNFSKKVKKIESLLSNSAATDVNKLKALAVSEGGLVSDSIRKIAWPKMLELDAVNLPDAPTEDELQNHPEYQQVVLDVNRSIKRFPPGIPLERRLALQSQLIFLILQVVTAHPRLRYYQGYHDVAITLLLVTGKESAYGLLEKLSTNHLKDCMEPTMEKTSHLLNYIYPLVRCQNAEVYEHLEKSGVGTMFALPWFLTWFGHSLNRYKDVVRLYDYFLASEPLAPLYVSAVIVVHRAKEILETPCDMANLHCLLSQIPDNLPFETLLARATKLYKNHPPKAVEKEVLERVQREQDQRNYENALRMRRMNQKLPIMWRVISHFMPNRRIPSWALGQARYIPHFPYLAATATVAFGIYAFYLKSAEAASVWDLSRYPSV